MLQSPRAASALRSHSADASLLANSTAVRYMPSCQPPGWLLPLPGTLGVAEGFEGRTGDAGLSEREDGVGEGLRGPADA